MAKGKDDFMSKTMTRESVKMWCMDCRTCKSLSGELKLSPGPVIHEGVYWRAEHIYPTKTLGWLVIVLKRHVEALHDLSVEEVCELGEIQLRLALLLHQELRCSKEYSWCFADTDGFSHIHSMLFATPNDLDSINRGANIFDWLNSKSSAPILESEVVKFCETLRRKMSS